MFSDAVKGFLHNNVCIQSEKTGLYFHYITRFFLRILALQFNSIQIFICNLWSGNTIWAF